MDKGFVFWILMLIWLVFGAYVNDWQQPNSWKGFGGNLLLFILLFLLGWGVFGFAIH